MILSRSPVRLSMGGGGTDLPSYYEENEGFLLATSINKYVYILLNKRFEDDIRLSYSKTEIVDDINQIEHPIFREALKLSDIKNSIELVSVADVPSNCGLGTSSSFTVALLNALFTYKRDYVTIDKLAETACHIDEHLMELQSNMFLFYLKKTRSASNVLKEQNNKSKEKDKDTLERLHRIKEIGIYTKKVLEAGKIDEFGEILHNHWITKKGLSDKVSDGFIDEVYNTALKNGALGGKVVGAGGGGFLLLYCPQNKPKLVESMKKMGLTPTWFNFEFEGAKKIYAG
ncbi:MAG: sugar kinase [Ignavibacteria bacterium]|nr:sugar kinase [Ignavibacteria bacterium]